MTSFKSQVVWITGASSGIGEALAYAFAKEGARLILTARRADELQRVKQACGIAEKDVLLLPLDVSKYEEIENASADLVAQFGEVDILINNAGISHWSKIKDLSLDVIKRVMDVNFWGGVALTKAVLPSMIKRKKGQIVVISSILGKIVTPKQAAYNASKHAIHGFYDTLRAETAGDGIRVLLVCPGFVRTNVAKNSLDRNGMPINKDNNMILKGIDPNDLAREILKAIRTGKEEIVLAGAKERFAVVMKRFAPGLFSKFISKTKLA